MTNKFTDLPRPAFEVSVVRLSCSACGAEANASCSCGKPYVPVAQRVAEYDEANPGRSTRQAAADLGIPKSTVSDARSGVRDRTGESGVPDGTPETVRGRDGKQYPARKSSLEYGQEQVAELKESYGDDLAGYSEPPTQYDLLDQVKPTILKMNPPTKLALATWFSEIYRR